MEGFKEGLAEEGFIEGETIVFDLQNANADTGISAQIADAFVNGNYDLICAVATPVAMSCFNAAQDKGIPVIYTAVSDPVGSQLANADGTNPGEITGTSDQLPVEAQLKLIRALMPDATKIGILHTTSETNSDSTLATYRALAPEYGFEIIDKGISTGADLPLGIEYLELGRQTGRMAARVLKGEAKASEIPFEIISNSYLYINEEALAQYGLSLPESLTERAISVNE